MKPKCSSQKSRRSTEPAGNSIWRLGRVAPMSPEEESEATREYARTHSPEVARRIATANLRLVIKMAGDVARRSPLPLADLVQEGCVGLMHAIERYEPDRNVRFASYASWWIRAFLLKYLLDNTRLVRAGRSREDRRGFFRGQCPAPEICLDAPVAEARESASLVDTLTDPTAELPDQAAEQAELSRLIRERAAAFGQTLSARNAQVFRERFLGDEAVSLNRLASRLSISKERVRQIEKELVDDFRAFAGAA